MCSFLIIFLSAFSLCSGIKMRITYSPEAPSTVPNGLYQEILKTVYLDARAVKTLTEPQYITTMEEITYRPELNEEELQSFYNFRNLKFVSMVNNGQKKIPNFRNLLKIKKIQIKQNKITSVDKNSISNVPVEVVDLQINEIREIEKGAFGKRVHSVDLKCNLLSVISTDWFRNASNLEWLSLESNKIEKLQENLFKKFIKLSELHLARNEIISLEPGSLSGPKYMNVLDLGSNDISIINADIFSAKHLHITNLRISFNRLSFITEDLMHKISINNSSVIYGNPWQCPCVKSIRDWLPATNVKYTFRKEASCVFTIENEQEQCFYDVGLNNELYNTYISSFDVVDSRSCSAEAQNIDEEKRKLLHVSEWDFGEIDLRRR